MARYCITQTERQLASVVVSVCTCSNTYSMCCKQTSVQSIMRRVLGCEAKHAGIAIWHFANEGISSPVRALNFFHIVSTQLIQIKDTVAFEIWNTKFISLSIIYPYNSKKLCLYDVLGAGLDRARPKSPPGLY
jgi:hypothetical protein